MRKKLVGGVATVALMATFSGKASAASHEVKPGDNLWKIASQYKTTVNNIKKLNGLSSEIIYPKQVLKVSQGSGGTSSSPAPKPSTASNSSSSAKSSGANAGTYKVVSGDTLSRIAAKYGTTVTKLKQANGLKSDLIYVGQVLRLNGSSSSAPAPKPSTASGSSSSAKSSGANAGTYKVVSGDTLGRIAAKYGTTVTKLKQANGLKSDLIYVGQVLRLNGSSSSAPTPKPSTAPSSGSSTSGNSGSASTHKVVSGDTLGRIAAKYGTTVTQLKQANGLRSDLIYAGQVLRLNGSSSSAASSGSAGKQTAASVSNPVKKTGSVVDAAKQQVGTKYAWGGTSPAGFDCSGFIYYAFKQAGHNISRLGTDGYYNRSHYVKSPQPGDLVFFKNTYRSGISHMGIYLGSNQFIHAGNNGVEITSLNNSYWKSKFDGFKKFY
ncbi:LysM peptidoglycan-binding domain-containing protein [Siminovitchia fortis]|nr:peptidoglycan endopeptidase [Siminovitchia fortis]WHY81736.1 LysM peptidoglycan-binding domain-containing protein [Siminovitchia fortis]